MYFKLFLSKFLTIQNHIVIIGTFCEYTYIRISCIILFLAGD